MTGFNGKKLKNIEVNCELPWDVLDIISKTLDFDDLFHFSGVCKNWRTFYKIYLRNFLAFQEPLLIQILKHGDTKKDSLSLISIHDNKVYCLKMMECFLKTSYLASSGGYFIKGGMDSFMLINPFTRIMKVIKASNFKVRATHANLALLAFSECSDEFVLVFLCIASRGLHVYQSRNCGWATYPSKMENRGRVVHFVVLHNIIYCVTNKANIGVLNLNYPSIGFLRLKNTPKVTSVDLKLVNCDEELLVVDLTFFGASNVYKIDLSTMSYVKLETLGDIALLCVWDVLKLNCYALSNPNRWGYESNSVYLTRLSSNVCDVYSGNDRKLKKCFTLPTPVKAKLSVPMIGVLNINDAR